MASSRQTAPTSSRAPRVAYVRRRVRNLKAAAAFVETHGGGTLRTLDAAQAVFAIGPHSHVLGLGGFDRDAVGLDLGDEAALDLALDRLAAAGLNGTALTGDECRARRVHRGARAQDPSGNTIELIVRPEHTATPELVAREQFVTGLRGVALASSDLAADTAFWTGVVGGVVSDWVGDVTYIKFDSYHHRVSLYPADKGRVLYPVLELARLDDLFRRYYTLKKSQAPILFGIGRAGPSREYFLKTRCADGLVYAFGYGMARQEGADAAPRQFEATAAALCTLGSECSPLAADAVSVGAVYTAGTAPR